jgi:hypothetical protein
MFGFLKRNKSKKNTMPQLVDLQNNTILEGDRVTALRYDLGVCKLVVVEGKYLYESEVSGEQVSWLKMIDASTDRQKVEKIVS